MAKILLIDDSESIRVFLEQILSGAGHQVLTAADGKHGLEILRSTPVDLIVTDIYMPELDGLTVMRRAQELCPGVRVIAMSDRIDTHHLRATTRAEGAFLTLKKPFTPQDLLTAVEAVLDPAPGPGANVKQRQLARASKPSGETARLEQDPVTPKPGTISL
jgi:two-component system chemotaxis response regulator CheY